MKTYATDLCEAAAQFEAVCGRPVTQLHFRGVTYEFDAFMERVNARRDFYPSHVESIERLCRHCGYEYHSHVGALDIFGVVAVVIAAP